MDVQSAHQERFRVEVWPYVILVFWRIERRQCGDYCRPRARDGRDDLGGPGWEWGSVKQGCGYGESQSAELVMGFESSDTSYTE